MFDLELDKVINTSKEKEHKTVMIQLPDGLKPQAQHIVDTLRKETQAEIVVWLSSCYGACDIPFGLRPTKIDLFVAWGHNRFNRIEGWGKE